MGGIGSGGSGTSLGRPGPGPRHGPGTLGATAVDRPVNREESTLRAASVQLNATEDTARNRERADRLVREAAARGAELVLLPEKWTVLGTDEQLRAGAEPLEGPTLAWARAAARELGLE